MVIETFRSKVDWWLAAILIAAPLLTLAALVGALISGDPLAQRIGVITAVGTLVLYFGVVWPVGCDLEERLLVVRAGLLRTRIPDSRSRRPSTAAALASFPDGSRLQPCLLYTSPSPRDS